MNEIVFEQGGTVDKFIGDAIRATIRAIFGAPAEHTTPVSKPTALPSVLLAVLLAVLWLCKVDESSMASRWSSI